MRKMNVVNELDLFESAMANFIAGMVVSKTKSQKIRRNMECRRKLELKLEERKLQREIREYDFEFLS